MAPLVVARWISSRRKLLAALGVTLAGLVAWRATRSGASEGSPERSLAAVLGRAGVRVDPDTVVWLGEDDGPWSLRPALFLARRQGELTDVWYAEVRPGRDGALLDVTSETNLTRSPSAAEEQLTRAGDRVAFVSRVADSIEALTVLDLRGEDEESLAGFSRTQRTQHAISNWQETGRTLGFGRVRYQLNEPTSALTVRADGDRVTLHDASDEEALAVEADGLLSDRGAELALAEPVMPGMPGGITWIVDTVRNLSFVGPAPIEWLENRVFALQDRWNRTRHQLFGSEDTREAVAEELGVREPDATGDGDAATEQATARRVDATEAEIGWPPPPMRPILVDDPVEGEGAWIPVDHDAFVTQFPGAPPVYAQSFIRPDAERPYARVYVTMWDPRQVQLHVVSGTREPESATGERGTGWIPRDERTMRTLVGAFDGGFQALHGEFGMMADGRVYLPPKPWAATLAVFDDGRVGMGSWPAPSWRGQYFDENLANRQIPEGMIAMRQNLTSMVEDGVWNPWERWWWGAAPQTDEEQTFTYRSGVCMTTEGHFAFFWGSSLGPEALGQAMIAARCARAMHLDMNSGHCGFEMFRPYRAEDALPPVRVGGDFEYDDAFPQAPGWRLRARKAVRSMAMRFPRYTAHDPRDFFYLTVRPILPGPPLANSTGDEGAFSTTGLPHAGWPYAFALARAGSASVVRIDPRRAVFGALREERHARPLGGFVGLPSDGSTSVYATRGRLGWELAVGRAGADDRVLAIGAPLADTPDAQAALGVDRDGFLVYAEGANVASAMARAGVSEAVALGDGRLALGTGEGASAPDGTTARPLGEGAVLVYAEERPASEVLFPDNTPMPYSRWGYLQGQRVRYFPDNPPRFVRDAGVR